MRSTKAYGIGMAPLVVWLLLTHGLFTVLDHLSDERMLRPVERQVYTYAHWGIRATDPLVVMACVIIIPLSMVAASRLWPWFLSDGAEPYGALWWVLVAVGSWSVAVTAIWLLLEHKRTLSTQLVVPLAFWSGGLANALAVSTGTLAQAQLERNGWSRISPWVVLRVGVALQVAVVIPAFVAGLVPVVVSWRHARSRPTTA